jgi:hypothetical protein
MWPTKSKKGLTVIAKEMKQQLVIRAEKPQQYGKHHDCYHQNQLFNIDQKHLYAELQGEEHGQPPNPEESIRIWLALWSEEMDHNQDAQWTDVIRKRNAKIPEQADIAVTTQVVQQALQ